MKRLLPLAVFPAVQIACFVGAGLTWREFPWLAGGLFALSVLALDLTVHIFLHECIHATRPEGMSWTGSFALTLVGGMPFDGYRLHHYNHHRNDNGPGDWSTTWAWDAAGGRRPRRRFAYVLGWPAALARARVAVRAEAKAGLISAGIQRRLRWEKIFLGVAIIALAAADWRWALGYVAMVYGGWALVSVHNFGQHLPIEGHDPATSFESRLYNALLFNNGLHAEHHADPAKAWYEVKPDPSHPRARGPHLVAAFRGVGKR
ncbi:MAG: fatty acid desaturase [Planctomycetota bacterium]